MSAADKENTYLSLEQLDALSLINDNLFWRQENGEQVPAEAHCALPLSYPDQYIVLRDPDERELGIIENLTGLPAEIREAICAQLDRRYFLPQILKINKMTERFGSAIWDLETDRGRTVISTRQLNEAVRELGVNHFLVIDVEGNRYEIKNLRALPPESQAHFVGR